MNRPLVMVAVALALAAGGSALGALARSPQAPEARVAPVQAYDREAARTFVSAGCWQCHTISTLPQLAQDFGPRAQGARAFGPDLAGIGGHFPDAWHFAHLHEPASVVGLSRMPRQHSGPAGTPWFEGGPGRPSAEVARLVRFLQSLDLEGRESRFAQRQPLTWPGGNASLGAGVFRAHCANCHGDKADGDTPVAALFRQFKQKPPANLARGRMVWRSSRYSMPTPDDLFTTVTHGLPGSGMRGYAGRLSPRERADVVAWLLELTAEAYEDYEPARFRLNLAPPPITPELVARGRELYLEPKFYACATCHGDQGRGDGPNARDVLGFAGFAPRDLVQERLRRPDLPGLYATIALGLGPSMAGVGKDDGSNEADIWALAAYVRSINRFEARQR